MIELHIISSQKDWRLQVIENKRFYRGNASFTKTFPRHVKGIVDAVKRIPSSPRWDGDDKAWVFPRVHPAYPVGRPSD